ncbi:MAG TPA: alpha/beta hydrolase-fold protein [Candidatus Acidoferrum sp.]|nr:alpha/beta hydrolase-fold protein [Candidatus Acidoferrum sp.]
MPYQFCHNGLLREFRLYMPIGWPYWVERAFSEGGRNGLPLVIALHGGAEDPETFSDDWPFHTLINSPSNANWEDRFFVLYPHGFAATTLANEPVRGWNTGFAGEVAPGQNDVGFIRQAVAAVEEMLRAELAQVGIAHGPIDADRRFLFGYSMGGMMAYKLAHELPDHFAALWAMSGAYGGRSHEGLTPTITNDPEGSFGLSLFAHHGEADVVVPPGPRNDQTGRTTSAFNRALYIAAGLQPADADAYAGSFRTLHAAVEEFKLYNDCEPGAASSSTVEADIGGGNGALKFVFQRRGNPSNPEVVVYRDPAMAHTGFTASPNRYFDAADVWDWFKLHPQV